MAIHIYPKIPCHAAGNFGYGESVKTGQTCFDTFINNIRTTNYQLQRESCSLYFLSFYKVREFQKFDVGYV